MTPSDPQTDELKDMERVEEDTDVDVDVDGGSRGWLAVFASFVVHFIVSGSIYSFGVYQVWQIHFKKNSCFRLKLRISS